jgi:hypothetical protein
VEELVTGRGEGPRQSRSQIMNRYTFVSGSHNRRLSVTAAAAALSAIAAVTVMPAAGQAVGDTASQRPCFIHFAHWNTALDGPQPVCARHR